VEKKLALSITQGLERIVNDPTISDEDPQKILACMMLLKIANKDYGSRSDLPSTFEVIRSDFAIFGFMALGMSCGLRLSSLNDYLLRADEIYDTLRVRVVKK